MDRRLVDHLVSRELVSRSQMQRVILRATRQKRRLVEQILDDPSVDEEQLARELASFHAVELVERVDFHVNRTALKFLSREMADQHGVLPYGLSADADEVSVAVIDPAGAEEVLTSLQSATGTAPSVFVAPRSWLRGAIRHYYFDDEWEHAPGDEAPRSGDSGFPTEGSAEILLDEVVEEPPLRGRKRTASKGRGGRGSEPIEASVDLSVGASSSPGRARGAVGDPVVAALDEFNDFLDTGNSSVHGIANSKVTPPALDDLEEVPLHGASLGTGWSSFDDVDDDDPGDDASGFGSGFAAMPLGGEREARAGFDLFDVEKSEATDGELTLHQIVERQEKTIQQLHRDVQQQREIIQVLVDMLGESRVLSKRELKKRIRKK